MLAINHPTYTQSTQHASDCNQDDSDNDSFSDLNTDNNSQTQWPTEWAEEQEEVSFMTSPSAMNESQPSTSIEAAQVYVSTQILSNNSGNAEEEVDEDALFYFHCEERNALRNKVGRNGFVHIYGVIADSYLLDRKVSEGNILKYKFKKTTYKTADDKDRYENMVFKSKEKKWYPKPWASVSTRQKDELQSTFYDSDETDIRIQITMLLARSIQNQIKTQ